MKLHEILGYYLIGEASYDETLNSLTKYFDDDVEVATIVLNTYIEDIS